MNVLSIIVESIGLMFGSMAAGLLVCWSLWSGFKLIGHPEWGPPFVLVPAALALVGRLPKSQFLAMTLIFATLAIVPFCAEGIAWRRLTRRRDGGLSQDRSGRGALVEPPTSVMPRHRYPAITGCIGEHRKPDPYELKKVAARILREGLDARQLGTGIAGKRAALRVAKVALEGVWTDTMRNGNVGTM
jgi:hypothetical protein